VHAVVEGLGDHGAEYMTGGGLIVLGSVGRNFAAGMSGGIAYVLNLDGSFNYFCNHDMVELTPAIGLEDQKYIKQQLLNHIHYTESSLAQSILDQWYKFMPKFIKVLPLDYKRMLEETKDHERAEQSDQMMTTYKVSPGMAKAEMFEEVS
jgi:glutamate synthase (NADPH) large chain